MGDAPIFVLNSLDASVSIIDPRSRTELQRLPTGKEPHHLYLTPDERSLIVANAASNALTFLDPRTGAVQRVVTDILDPYHLRFSPDMKWLVVAANRLNHIDIYRWQPENEAQPLQLAGRVAASKTPSHLAIDSKSQVVWASLQDSSELTAIDLNTRARLWTIPVGKMPADVYLTPDDQTLLIGLTGASEVQAWDVRDPRQAPKWIANVPTGDGAHAFRSLGDGRHVLVSNRVANTISRIDWQALKVVAQYPAPGGPDCMDVMKDGKTLLYTSRWSRHLTTVDMSQGVVTNSVPVGRSPHGVWTLNHVSTR